MPLITELIVVADKAAVWELTDNKDCVGKIKSSIKGRDDKQGTLFPIREKKSPGSPTYFRMGISDTGVLPLTIFAGS